MAPMTMRKRIIGLLVGDSLTIRDISRLAGIPEKEVIAHLPHIRASARAEGRRLVIEPWVCLSCGHVFRERTRFSRPGRCPVCKGERMDDALFSIR